MFHSLTAEEVAKNEANEKSGEHGISRSRTCGVRTNEDTERTTCVAYSVLVH